MRGRWAEQLGKRRVLGWLIAGSAACLLLPARWTQWVDDRFGGLLGPLSRGGRELSLAVTEDWRGEVGERPTVGDYQRLRQEYEGACRELENVRQQVRGLEEENARWSGVRGAFGAARVRLVTAAVVGSSSAGWSRTVQVDRGTADGVREGQMVLAVPGAEGAGGAAWARACVAGRVAEAGPQSAQVQWVNDAAFRLPVFIEPRSGAGGGEAAWRADGMLRGGQLGEVEVELISADYPIRVGDWVVACSDPWYLPAALAVGTVQRCERNKESPVFWRIVVQPAGAVHDLRQVLIVAPQWQQEQS